MLECRACTHRCLRSFLSDALNIKPPIQRHYPIIRRSGPHTSWLRRNYATEAVPFEHSPFSGVVPAPIPQNQVKAAGTDSVKRLKHTSKTSLEQELRWLKDPLKLGDNTVKLLRQDEVEKALEIVRMASKDIECTVSWNHLIDYFMSKGQVAAATKLYNEMKKRAQSPDAHTFTTLFRGYSWHPKFSLSVPRATAIYHSMFADNSPVKPSVIHTNAVLKVCALAGDIDALLGVAANLPSRGSGSADNLTYTIILNAIRSDAWEASKGAGEKSAADQRKRIQAVRQGKKLWVEIRTRWKKGDLYIDEELVCAMGRLLLITSEEHDCDDILSLVEQTMQLPRQVSRFKDSDSRNILENDGASSKSGPHAILSSEEEDAAIPQELSAPAGEDSFNKDIFAVIPMHASMSKSAVRPGRNTLSLLLDACIRTTRIRAAQNYWGMLTDPEGPFKIVPDSENYHMYLRLLRAQRASRLAVDLITDMHAGNLGPKFALQPKTFRLGLSCCVRDKNNSNSIGHAKKLVRLMLHTLPDPDAKALSMYIQVALSRRPVDWRMLMDVMHDTDAGMTDLRSLQAYEPEKRKENKYDLQDLAKALVSAIDVVLEVGNEGMSEKERKWCKATKYRSAAWITRRANKVQGISFGSRKPRLEQRPLSEVAGVNVPRQRFKATSYPSSRRITLT